MCKTTTIAAQRLINTIPCSYKKVFAASLVKYPLRMLKEIICLGWRVTPASGTKILLES